MEFNVENKYFIIIDMTRPAVGCIHLHTRLVWAQSYWHAHVLPSTRGLCGHRVIDMHMYCPAHLACVGTELLTCTGIGQYMWLVWALGYWHTQVLPSTPVLCGHWLHYWHAQALTHIRGFCECSKFFHIKNIIDLHGR